MVLVSPGKRYVFMGYVLERHVPDNKVGMDFLLGRGTVQPVGHNFIVIAVWVI